MIVTHARYHRNGSFGAGYYAIRFRHLHDGAWREMRATLFDAAEHVAILDDNDDSWRCEDFEGALRAFIASAEGEQMIWGNLAHASPINEP